MVDPRKYTVRLFKAAKSDFKEPLKVYLSALALDYQDLRAGDLCQLTTATQSQCPVIVWPASEEQKLRDTIIQTSKTLQTLCDLKLGDQVTLSRSSDHIRDAHVVIVLEHGDSEGFPSPPNLDQSDKVFWSRLLKHELKKSGHLCPGMISARVRAIDEDRTFRIVSIDGGADKFLYHSASIHSVEISATTKQNYEVGLHNLDVSYVGGLKTQMSRLGDTIEAFSLTAERYKIFFNQPPARQGIILHGPAGTGKSMLLGMLAKAGWRGVFHIKKAVGSGRIEETEKAIRSTFEEARRLQPSIIIIDDLDAIAGKSGVADDSLTLNLASGLCQAFDELCDDRMLVVAATRKLAAIDESLRCSARFNKDIEIPVPSTDARLEILNIVAGLQKDAKDHRLLRLAERTHGYTGSDLNGLVENAMEKAALRIRRRHHGKSDSGNTGVGGKLLKFLEGVTEDEIEAALLEIQPTAMKQVFLDTPKVKWSEIGGQAEVKEALRMAVEWPLKTLVAKAVATEAQLNFIAVKGAEILSMYVGESERTVRELFQRARVASPSILFFDEIDAIGAARQPSQQGGLHVLTTLLNELDGIEALKGVFVLAATNNPEMLDSALLRPGRLESALYVGLPDYETRLEIFAITTHAKDLAVDIDFVILAKTTEGYTGAEIVHICRLAGQASLKEELAYGIQSSVSMKHFEIALTQVQKRTTEAMIKKYKVWGGSVGTDD
ncbi:MAG: hypothetical protein Q9184_001991 [Pyrenodesmia sp. 2 TL-2023]